MPPVIENPILNSPFHEPGRHFRFNEEGITGDLSAAGIDLNLIVEVSGEGTIRAESQSAVAHA